MSRKVTVVGSGLAGLYAAHSAAVHGAEVELFEKSMIGTHHSCGEMFTEIYTSAPEECKLNKINILDLKLNESMFSVSFSEEMTPFVMTDKCKHELVMKEKCERVGVKIYEKLRVSINSKDSFVIDASGTSNYNRSMGKAVTYVVDRRIVADKKLDTACWDFLPYNAALFVMRKDLMGYSWIFPRGKEQLNIGDGVYDYKQKVVFDKPDKKYIVYSGGGLIPIPTMEEFYKHNFGFYDINSLKVGNAAGLVNPIAAGGEHLAAMSGMLAGYLVARKQESKYKVALNEIIGDEMRIGITFYELAKKQDEVTLKMLLRLIFDKKFKDEDIERINKNMRKTIAKWLPVPDVDESEMIKFVGDE